jgi:hypothetical protein
VTAYQKAASMGWWNRWPPGPPDHRYSHRLPLLHNALGLDQAPHSPCGDRRRRHLVQPPATRTGARDRERAAQTRGRDRRASHARRGAPGLPRSDIGHAHTEDRPSLYKARPGDSLSSVARARTLTVLPRLDGDRKARVVQFLHESGLIAKNCPIVAMSGANLSWAVLIGADL